MLAVCFLECHQTKKIIWSCFLKLRHICKTLFRTYARSSNSMTEIWKKSSVLAVLAASIHLNLFDKWPHRFNSLRVCKGLPQSLNSEVSQKMSEAMQLNGTGLGHWEGCQVMTFVAREVQRFNDAKHQVNASLEPNKVAIARDKRKVRTPQSAPFPTPSVQRPGRSGRVGDTHQQVLPLFV